MLESKGDNENIRERKASAMSARGVTDTGGIGSESAPSDAPPQADTTAGDGGRTPLQDPARDDARVQKVIESVNTGVAIGLLAVLLGVWVHWLFSGDEPATGLTTSTESLEEVEPRSAADTGIGAPVVSTPAMQGPTARAEEDALNLLRTDRRRIQAALRASGLDPEPAGGVFGAGTRAAIRDWQAARGAPPTGYLNKVEAEELIVLGSRSGKDMRADALRSSGRPKTGLEGPSDTSQDILTGRDGNDRTHLVGGFGEDNITGTDSDDTINGWHGKDTLDGSGGNDKIHGGFGDDTIYGGDGDDTIYGDHGNDTLDGAGGNDKIHGGFGDDTIHGGNGDDILNGGPGKDIFRFGQAHGTDRIRDFRRREDRIDLSELPVAGFEKLSLKAVRGGVQIDLTDADGGTVLLDRLALVGLDAPHFVFGSIIAGGTGENPGRSSRPR